MKEKLWWIAISPVVFKCSETTSVSLWGWRASLALGWETELATSAQHLLRAQLEAISRVWKGHSWISRLSSKINDSWQSVYVRVCVFPLNVTLSLAGGVPLISGLCDPHSRHWRLMPSSHKSEGSPWQQGPDSTTSSYICSNYTLAELRGCLYRKAADSIARCEAHRFHRYELCSVI